MGYNDGTPVNNRYWDVDEDEDYQQQQQQQGLSSSNVTRVITTTPTGTRTTTTTTYGNGPPSQFRPNPHCLATLPGPTSSTTPTTSTRTTAAASSTTPKKKRPHIQPGYEIILLREIVKDFPPEKPSVQARKEAWEAVSAACNRNRACGPDFGDPRRCSDRYALLLKKVRANELESLRATGVDEEFEERELLLTELINMTDELAVLEVKAKVAREESQGEKLRAAALTMMAGKTRPADSGEEATGAGSSNPAPCPDKGKGKKPKLDLGEWAMQEAAGQRELEERRLALKEQRLVADRRRNDQMNSLLQLLLSQQQHRAFPFPPPGPDPAHSFGFLFYLFIYSSHSTFFSFSLSFL
ncbi:hypothetical protein DFS34DRAFT_666271 [Phlyctochytrium arcticum]|nr:hypothetical protein DFS34DRAFT_666271 [Phlyctochytrium arcticum]